MRRISALCSLAVLYAWALAGAAPDAATQVARSVQGRSTEYVGADACAACHREKYDLWKSGRHSKMVQPAGPDTVLGNFEPRELMLRGSRFRLRQRDGSYFITESNLSGHPREHRVEYTLGSRRIQHYLTTIEQGRIVVLAPTWDVQRREWFHNLDIVRPDEDDRRILQQWNRNCVGCHVSQQENNYDPATGEYATRWVDFGTSCERCHGPGRAHVDAAGRAPIVRPTRLDAAAGSMVCAQCHSMRSMVAPGFTAGSDYYDYFQPVLEYGPRAAHDPAYWADGRPRRFSNDAIGFWQSQCFLKGGASCTTCHLDPHLPNIERNPQLAAGNNALCTGCHAPIAANLTAHTRHQPQSSGSACVECHMPNTVVGIKARMRDHTIGVPVPENTVRHGVPNACTECHADRSPAWAVAAIEKWWPRAYRRTRLIEQADAFAAARETRPEALAGLLAIAADAQRPPLVRANAIGHLAGYDAAPATATLIAALKGGHPAIRAAAADALGQRLAERPAAGPALLSALDDPRRSVRVAAVVAFVNAGGQDPPPADRARFARASAEFAARAALYEDDPDLQRSLGIVRLLNGQFDAAAGALQIVLKLAPDTPSVRYLLALARLGQRRVDAARELLNDVKESDPYYRNARMRLQELK